MKKYLSAAVLCCLASAAQAGPIANACLTSERAGANHSLCNCIQSAADKTLTRRDQRLAASFFQDPHRAQEIRQSNQRSHETFWERYRAFGETAEAFCS